MFWSQPNPWANTMARSPCPASRTLFRCAIDTLLPKPDPVRTTNAPPENANASAVLDSYLNRHLWCDVPLCIAKACVGRHRPAAEAPTPHSDWLVEVGRHTSRAAGPFQVTTFLRLLLGSGRVTLSKRLFLDEPLVGLTSGYSHVLAQNGQHGFELLHKPYSIEQLSHVLRKAISW